MEARRRRNRGNGGLKTKERKKEKNWLARYGTEDDFFLMTERSPSVALGPPAPYMQSRGCKHSW